MKAKTLGAQLQLLVPTTINADGDEIGVLNTQNEPSWYSTRFRKGRMFKVFGLTFR